VAALVTLAETVMLRTRLGALSTLDLSIDDAPAGEFVWCVGRSVSVPAAVQRAAEAHLVANDLDWLDLVPVDLPVDRLFDLLWGVDPAKFRADRVAAGRTAGVAMVMRRPLAERLELDSPAPGTDAPGQSELVRIAAKAKQYAPVRCDFAVAPTFEAGVLPQLDLDEVREIWGGGAGMRLGAPIVQSATLLLGLARRRTSGVVAWLSVTGQPVLVMAGNRQGLRPRGLRRDVATHAVRSGLRNARALSSAPPSPQREAVEAARPAYAAELARGTERFLSARRSACPWCGSSELRLLAETSDLLQQKPGRFALDRCESCGHAFQNPAVTPEGLGFYYRDFYDGLSGEKVEWGFQKLVGFYRARAAMVRRQTQPTTWLDVGGGHGHFCLIAREELPETTFEALDQADSIVEAERRGWVDRAHQGAFLDLASDLERRFDVVSMHHYLEHTTDPKAELDAAAKMLAPGTHLLVEVPDPEFRLARLLGGWWTVYLQPQHLHLIPLANLEEALRERGFEIVEVDRARAHQPIDLFAAVWTAARRLGPPTDVPWLPPPSPTRIARQVVASAAAAPFLVVAAVGDQLVSRILRDTDHGNTYRVLARRT
jgi:ubiquinone/menaquinone biosynthesis C-methylase UbiE